MYNTESLKKNNINQSPLFYELSFALKSVLEANIATLQGL